VRTGMEAMARSTLPIPFPDANAMEVAK
jgi:hypothetical protein